MLPRTWNPKTHRAFVDLDGDAQICEVPAEIRAWTDGAGDESTGYLDTIEARLRAMEQYRTSHPFFPFDLQVDVYAQDAERIMAKRRAYGYAWIHCAYDPSVGARVAPGTAYPTLIGRDQRDPGAAPTGAIFVPQEG